MDILIPDVASPEGAQVAGELVSAGHLVHHCFGPGDTGTACAALRHQPCPVERSPIDLVVAVKAGTTARDHLAGEGTRCGLRRKIPVLVADPGTDRYRRWGAAEAPEASVAAAVVHAARQPLTAHSVQATELLHELLERHHVSPAGSRAEVWRRDGRLRVLITTRYPLATSVSRVLSVRIPQRLRTYDPWAGGLDLSFSPPPER